MNQKDLRRVRLYAKLAFPQINTQQTKFIEVPPGLRDFCLPALGPVTDYETIQLNKWIAQKKNISYTVYLGYSAKLDTVVWSQLVEYHKLHISREWVPVPLS